MQSVNKVILIGNLGKDPEVKQSPEGNRVVTLSVATSDSWKDKTTGERKDRTEWHRVVIFNIKLGEIAENYLKKGSKVFIEGHLQTRKWVDKSNVEHYTTEVVLSRFKGELVILTKDSNDQNQIQVFRETAVPVQKSNLSAELEDEIPF